MSIDLMARNEVETYDWKFVRLGGVVRMVTDGISASELSELPRVHHYSLPAFDVGAGPEVGPGEPIKSNKTVVPDDCVLFSKLNPRIPRVWRIKGSAPPHSYCSTEFWPLVARTNDVDLDYLTQYLSSAAFLGHPDITPSSSTNSHQRVDRKAFETFEFFLPPLDEQRRIAEVLRSVDEVIVSQSHVCACLRATADNLADELYAREIQAVDEHLTEYGKACETVQVGIVVKPASYYVEDGGVPALRSTNIKRNEIDFSALVELSHEGHTINGKSALRAGDVVTIRTGEPGKTAVIPDDAPAALNCIDIIFSRPKPVLRPHFAAFFINSSTARVQIAAMQGGLAQQHFNVGEMKRLQIPLPSLERQDRVIEVMQSAWRAIRVEEAQLATLRSAKVALVSDLLTGRVRVPA